MCSLGVRREYRVLELSCVTSEALIQFYSLLGVVLHVEGQAALSINYDFFMVTTEDAIESCFRLKVHLIA